MNYENCITTQSFDLYVCTLFGLSNLNREIFCLIFAQLWHRKISTNDHKIYHILFVRPAIHLSWNTQKWAQNVKNKKCIAGYFASLFSLFVFHSILHQGRHSRKNSKDFVVYFFTALMKCENWIVNVSYFVVYFAKNTRKLQKMYSWPNSSDYTLLANKTWF